MMPTFLILSNEAIAAYLQIRVNNVGFARS